PRNGLIRAARRGGPGRRTIDGGCTAFRTRLSPTRGGRDHDRTTPGALSTLARPDLQPDRRPGGGRRDAPERRAHGPRVARDPVRRATRHWQDVARADRREG